MIKSLKTLIACTTLVLLAGCLRQEVVVSEYTVPAMTSQQAVTYLEQKLQKIPGTEEIHCDPATGKMTITYNSVKARYMNYEEAIAQLGFDVNDRPANPQRKAALPKGLK